MNPGPAPRLAAWYFAYFAYAGVMVPYFALYLQALALSAAQIALVLAMPQLARIVAPALWGWIADRTGARRAIVVFSGVALVIGYAVLSQVRDAAGIALVLLVLSIASAGAMPIVEALALSTLGAHTGRYGPVRLWGSLSFIATVLLAGVWLDHQPPHTLLAIIWTLALGALGASLFLPRAEVPAANAPTAPLGALLRRPEVVALLGACFCMVFAHGALYAFFSIHLEQAGYPKTAIGVLWTLGVVAEIVVFLFLPRLLRAWSLRALLLVSFLLATLRFATIGWAVEWWWAIALAQLLHGATFGVYHAASLAAVHRLFEGRLQARGQALYTSLSYGVGGVLGTLLAGWTWDSLGPGPTFTASALAAVFGTLLVVRGVRR